MSPQFWRNLLAPPSSSDDPRVRFGPSVFFPVSLGHAVFVALVVLSGETGEAWRAVAAVAVAQVALSFPMGLVMSWPGFYAYANLGLASVNFSAGAAMIMVCGGYPTPMWMSSLFGVFPAAFFLGRAGAFINAAVCLTGLLYPHMPYVDGAVVVAAGAQAMSVMVLGLVAAPMFEMVARAEAEQRAASAALQDANEGLTRALHEAKCESERKLLLNEMNDMIQSSADTAEAFSILAGFGRRLFPAHLGALFIYRNSRDSLELSVHWGGAIDESDRAFKPSECWALRRGLPHFSDGASAEVSCRHLRDLAGGALCVPMMAQGEILGVFHIRAQENTPGEIRTPPIDDTLAVTVARDGAMGLANLRLRETLRNQALRDGLTQLYNRRYFDEALPREVHRAQRRGHPIAVVMLDIDNFKLFNDTYGHAAGDAVLREVGVFLASHTRKEDLACRYGGEEFALVFAETSLATAVKRAEALRAGLEELRVRQGERPLGRLTVSAGVAATPEVPAEDLMKVADALLYRAKAEGRNRIVAAA